MYGQIGDISYFPRECSDVKSVTVEHDTTAGYFEDGHWVMTTERTASTVNAAIDDLTYDYLEETDIDWYNNDGGFGELVIDVEDGTVALEVNVRYTDSTTEFCAERDILTGEAV